MNKVKITVMRAARYDDLIRKYENPIEHACDLKVGQVFVADRPDSRPDGLCESAWETMRPFVADLAAGGGDFFGGWMKDPRSAMLSCNDGFRPVSFLLEAVENRRELTVRPASEEDIPRISEIYAAAREYMKRTGNPTQWGDQKPLPEDIEADVRLGRSRVVCDNDGTVRGVFALFTGADPTYASIEDGAWPNGEEYLTIHRIAGDGSGGVFACAVDCCKSLCDNLRIDTHENNSTMRHLVAKHGFVRCGIIHLADGSPRIAYQWTRGAET